MAKFTAKELADMVRNLSPDDKADFAERLSPTKPPKGMPEDDGSCDKDYGTVGISALPYIQKAFNTLERLLEHEDPSIQIEAAVSLIDIGS